MCNATNCRDINNTKRKICFNAGCGFDSVLIQGALLCRLCKIAEKNKIDAQNGENGPAMDEAIQKPDLKKTTGVRLGDEIFVFERGFFDIIQIFED